MKSPRTLVISGGGMRSLVALGIAAEHEYTAGLYIHDGRPSNVFAFEAFERQIEYFKIGQKLEATAPNLWVDPKTAHEPAAAPRVPLGHLQILSIASGMAIERRAHRVIWPIQAGDDFETIGRVTELVLMVRHAMALEFQDEIVIETPFLDLSDKQLIELGQQMRVPWELARSCYLDGLEPCGDCIACHRRRQAFGQAMVEDPIYLATGGV